MCRDRLLRFIAAFLALYIGFSSIAAVLVAEGALHPWRKPLTALEEANVKTVVARLDATVDDLSIIASDKAELRGWLVRPRKPNGKAVIVLHGLSDNRLGMIGYAELLTARGYTVLVPDARVHGLSGGKIATYGLIEREDVRRWFDWLIAQEHPECIFGFGGSMGAAQLLQALDAEPHFCAVAVESPFANFREVAYDRMGQRFHLGPWFGRTILRPVVEFAFLYTKYKYGLDMERVSPENAVARTSAPVLLIHGIDDSNIPIRHSRRIAEQNPHSVLWEVPATDHCGAISTHPQEFEQRLITWFTEHSPSHNQ